MHVRPVPLFVCVLCSALLVLVATGCGPSPSGDGDGDSAGDGDGDGDASGDGDVGDGDGDVGDGDGDLGDGDGDGDIGDGDGDGDVLYYPHIATLMQNHCTACHQGGGIGPFDLDSYNGVKDLGEIVAAVTSARMMPPFGVDASGACQDFADARWLSESEIADIAAWVDDGMPEGDPADAPGPPVQPPVLEEEDALLDIGVEYMPTGGADDYRCFLVDPGTDVDQFLVGFEVHPGAPEVVHHVVIYSLLSAGAEQQAEANDAADPGPGYTCFGGPGVSNTNYLAGWAPGTPAQHMPGNTGIRVLAGRKLVMQMHYNLAAGSQADRTTVSLDLEPEVEREAVAEFWLDFNMALAPGEESVSFEFGDSPGWALPADVDLLGVFPHMHTLGREMRIDHIPAGGGEVCLADVPRWDFNWQQTFFYEEPVPIDAGDRLRVRCTYDTTSRSTTTYFGEGTADEMCVSVMYYAYR